MADEGTKEAKVGGQDAGYLFEFKPEGVFLTVYPTACPICGRSCTTTVSMITTF
ncbi:hypothetical protein [uncultured Selenomonas sp.]|uniref:hypothetical protein n=1 Tax=uncultured Selenomonas sp. TaxID=159275 RepID=UPI0025DD1964|nr:hypothetical protein [uncultured Selenomonas sp.]